MVEFQVPSLHAGELRNARLHQLHAPSHQIAHGARFARMREQATAVSTITAAPSDLAPQRDAIEVIVVLPT
jgi:hypothetical protein